MIKSPRLAILILLFTVALIAFPSIGCFSATKGLPVMTLTLPDGSQYQGAVLNKQPHGRGVKTFPDGRQYSGLFRNGEFDGYGVMSYPDGRRETGNWQAGKLISNTENIQKN